MGFPNENFLPDWGKICFRSERGCKDRPPLWTDRATFSLERHRSGLNRLPSHSAPDRHLDIGFHFDCSREQPSLLEVRSHFLRFRISAENFHLVGSDCERDFCCNYPRHSSSYDHIDLSFDCNLVGTESIVLHCSPIFDCYYCSLYIGNFFFHNHLYFVHVLPHNYCCTNCPDYCNLSARCCNGYSSDNILHHNAPCNPAFYIFVAHDLCGYCATRALFLEAEAFFLLIRFSGVLFGCWWPRLTAEDL
mmetsp:Transcript_12678/g.18968  ORF Transcript_12678/g.18968 Transcript_12678/m.18968 type:complete len:248 (-) Transcript_12678:553-1296(-)